MSAKIKYNQGGQLDTNTIFFYQSILKIDVLVFSTKYILPQIKAWRKSLLEAITLDGINKQMIEECM